MTIITSAFSLFATGQGPSRDAGRRRSQPDAQAENRFQQPKGLSPVRRRYSDLFCFWNSSFDSNRRSGALIAFNFVRLFFPCAFRVLFVLRIGHLCETWNQAVSAEAVGGNLLLLRSQGPRGPVAIACPVLTPNQSFRPCDLAWRFLHRLEVVGGFC